MTRIEPLVRALLVVAAVALPVTAGAGPVPERYPSEEAVTHYAAGLLLEAQGREVEALGAFARALTLDPQAAGAARHVSELSARLGETERSLEFAVRALALDPEDARALLLKGVAELSLGRPALALGTLEAAVRADSTQVEALRALARTAEQLDRVDEVARAWRRAVELDEEDGEAWFQLAAAEARLGRFGAADTALASAVELNPLRPGVLFLDGWIHESTGKPAEAIVLYRRHLKLHDADLVTRRRLVNLLIAQRRHQEAYAEARIVSRARPQDPEALEIEADLALWTRRPAEAARLLERLRKISPEEPEGTARAIAVLHRHKRTREANELAGSWAAEHPGDYRGPMLVARAHVITGTPEAGIAPARKAIEMAPDSLAPRVLLGRLYQSLKQFAEAESVWTEAARRFPDRTPIELDLAFCREQQGDLDGAERSARGVLAREPRNPTALNFLGYLFADHDRRLPEAEDLIRRALEQEPDNGAFLDSMGWVYFRMGRLAEARVPLERAVGLTGGDPVVREHLGDVYKGLKLLELAREQYRRALAADSANARVRTKLVETR